MAAKRKITIPLVPATITNLNFKPEKHGDEYQPRADLSLEFLLKTEDVDELVDVKDNVLKVLWDKDGASMFRELGDAGIPIALKADGTAQVGISEEALLEFDTAILKAIKVTPVIGRSLTVVCQVRVDPSEHMDHLADLAVGRKGVFAFGGSQVATGNEKDDQGKLEV